VNNVGSRCQCRVTFALLVVLTAATSVDATAADTVAGDHVTVSLASEYTSLQRGRPASLGVHFALEPGWHVYWQNPGDSGEAPSAVWTLPPGFSAGAFEWPAPMRIRVGPLANYGYEQAVMLPVRLDVPADAVPDRAATIEAALSWLVCRAEECIPGSGRLSTTLPIAPTSPAPDPRWAAAFADARRRQPVEELTGSVEAASDGTLRLHVVGLPADSAAEFFPLERGVVENAAPQDPTPVERGLALRLQRSPEATGPVSSLTGVVSVASAGGLRAYRVIARPPRDSFGVALALALAGGFLLNLMPCVFPVLSLKILAFVDHAAESPHRLRAHGWVFALGVLTSFWLLAGILIALRAGGAQLGWGYQLQSPVVVAGLAALMVLLALGLAGVWEIGLGLTGVGQRVQRKRGLVRSFWTGVLATVVATPCTAPFMGVALGWALTQPAVPALLVFTALGTGMAAPYLVLAHVPTALHLLPRPGPWMETLKGVLAFPLLATALWLLWVFDLQVGRDATFALLAALLTLSLAVWLWGRGQTRVRRTYWHVAAAVVVLAAVPLVRLALSDEQRAADVAATDDFWSPWSPAREAALRAAGKSVFVNYTAAWCLTCQVNERLVFSAPEVRAAFRRHDVAALRADWTDRNDEITRALAVHGRNGVPLYVFYPADAGAHPRLLPQLPTRETVIRTFGDAAGRNDEKETT